MGKALNKGRAEREHNQNLKHGHRYPRGPNTFMDYKNL